jgi:hypothetical protein
VHTCDKSQADLTLNGLHYRLDSLAELKTLAHLRGMKGVHFPDYPFTLERLKEAHKQELRRRRAEQRAV